MLEQFTTAASDREQVVLRPLISVEDLDARVTELAGEIARDCESRDVLVVGLLTGAFVFVADVVRRLAEHGVAVQVAFVKASSYGSGTTSSGQVRLEGHLPLGVAGRHVLLVDDILDTGHSLAAASELLRRAEPASLRTCVLLDKPSRRVVDVTADYVGFTVPDAFVVGYGIDYAERFRELPGIMTVGFAPA